MSDYSGMNDKDRNAGRKVDVITNAKDTPRQGVIVEKQPNEAFHAIKMNDGTTVSEKDCAIRYRD